MRPPEVLEELKQKKLAEGEKPKKNFLASVFDIDNLKTAFR